MNTPVSPAHYRAHPSGIECIQITEHMNFNLGNAIKYIWRAGLKGDAREDLAKAEWYLSREIDRITNDDDDAPPAPRDAVYEALARAARLIPETCVCGDHDSPGVDHRADGPCHHPEPVPCGRGVCDADRYAKGGLVTGPDNRAEHATGIPEPETDDLCCEPGPRLPFLCTRQTGHVGPHKARKGSDELVASWPQPAPAAEPPVGTRWKDRIGRTWTVRDNRRVSVYGLVGHTMIQRLHDHLGPLHQVWERWEDVPGGVAVNGANEEKGDDPWWGAPDQHLETAIAPFTAVTPWGAA